MQVKFKLLHEGARLPERGHGIDVGLDVFMPEAGVLQPGPNKLPVGFSVDVPVGYSAEFRPRSGMASGEKTKALEVEDGGIVGHYYLNGVAVIAQSPPIDPGYSGEVHAIITNHSDLRIMYPAGTRLGQLIFYPVAYAQPVAEVDTSRGADAFGSTGIGAKDGIGD